MDPFKQEALRLVSELIDAAHGTVLNEDQSREDEARVALLAHIQRGVPDMYDRIAEAHDASLDEDHTGCRAILKECMRLLAAPTPDHFCDAAVEKAWGRFEAELQRGQVKGAAPAEPPMPEPADPDPLHLSRILHELAGAASLCWEPRPTGVFDSQLAIQFVEQALAEIRSRMTPAPAEVPEDLRMRLVEAWDYGQFADDFDQPLAKRIRADIRALCELLASRVKVQANPTAPAEVPMPEAVERAMVKVIDTSADVVCASDEWNKENDANFKRLLKRSKDAQEELRATVQQYGDAREAEGYARGLANAGSVLGVERGILEATLRCEAKPAKCDGNHGGPRCADPECWNDTADVRMPDDEVMRDALEHLAGLDTHDVNLRDNPKAYEVLERLVRTCYAPWDAVEPIRWVTDGSIPDADELVLVEGPDHGDVWGGCYDGEQWLTQDGMPVDVKVIAWAQWPAGSKGGAV